MCFPCTGCLHRNVTHDSSWQYRGRKWPLIGFACSKHLVTCASMKYGRFQLLQERMLRNNRRFISNAGCLFTHKAMRTSSLHFIFITLNYIIHWTARRSITITHLGFSDHTSSSIASPGFTAHPNVAHPAGGGCTWETMAWGIRPWLKSVNKPLLHSWVTPFRQNWHCIVHCLYSTFSDANTECWKGGA